jgi:hypothetical protein
MIRPSKIIVLLSIAMFLIAAVLPGHVGHLSVLPHSSDHGSVMAQDLAPFSLLEQASDEHHSGKDDCDHTYDLACSSAHCWYPAPETVLAEAVSKEPHDHLDFASANLRDRRVNLPPPRSS